MRFYDIYSNIVLKEENTQNFNNKASHIQVMCNNITLENCKKKLVKRNLLIILDDVQNLKVIEELQFCDKGVMYPMKSFDA